MSYYPLKQNTLSELPVLSLAPTHHESYIRGGGSGKRLTGIPPK